jgi:phage shock protein PspC (stress-responsive transcriptional regulator)
MEIRLRRARRDRWLLGVCGGLAHTYGLSPAGVRLVTVILAIVIPGASVFPTFLAYIVLGLLLRPSEEF